MPILHLMTAQPATIPDDPDRLPTCERISRNVRAIKTAIAAFAAVVAVAIIVSRP